MEGKNRGNICNVQCVMILVIFLVVEGIFATSLSSLNHSYYLSFQTSDPEKAEPGDILGYLGNWGVWDSTLRPF